jgi:UPF0176 protein
MINILYYKYVKLDDLEEFQRKHLGLCEALGLQGRVLIGKEGINGNLTGEDKNIEKYKKKLVSDTRFKDIEFKEGYANEHNFRKMFVRIRNEIVTTDYDVSLEEKGSYIEPKDLKKALDDKEDIILLDARNDYEYKIGKFRNARTLEMYLDI